MSDRYAKIGRNSPCPCGSGKKYKRCCLASCAPRPETLLCADCNKELEFGEEVFLLDLAGIQNLSEANFVELVGNASTLMIVGEF